MTALVSDQSSVLSIIKHRLHVGRTLVSSPGPGPGLSPGEWQLRCPLPLTQAPGTKLSTILSTRDMSRGKLSPVSQRSISFHTHRNELSNIFMAPVYFVLKQNRKCRKLTGYIPSTVTMSSLHTFYIYIPK